MKNILLLSLFVIGVIYRLGFVHLFPQPFVFDQWDYDDMAKDMIAQKEYQTISPYHAFRTAGYPFILAATYYFFGKDNQLAWMSLQAILDTLVAIFIFLIARKVFTHQTPAWIALFIYLFNPFTSAYVGLRLTEITSIFLMVLVFLLTFIFFKTKNLTIIVLSGFILGFLPQVRPSFTFYCVAFLIFLLYKIKKFFWNNKLIYLVVSLLFLILFSIPFAYNVWRNLTYFHRFSISTVDNVFIKEFYISLLKEKEYGSSISPEENLLHQEYSITENKGEMDKKYWHLAVVKIKQNPQNFLITRLRKMWYIWEKHHIFVYYNTENPFSVFIVYWSNIGLLVAAVLGYFSLIRENINLKKKYKWFTFFTGFLFVYFSIIHTLTHASERFSIPAYPFVFLFASYGIWKIIRHISKWLNPKPFHMI